MKKYLLFLTLITILTVACKTEDVTTSTTTGTTTSSTDGTTTNDFKKLYDKMNNLVSIDYSGSTSTIIKTNNVPDHKSPFFGVGHAKYEAYNGDNPSFSTKINLMGTDQYLGHPTPTVAGAQYHYHYEPTYLTKTYGNSSFMGFLLDGFPVYGPYENGKKVTTADLDIYNGHVGPTEDYPNDKIYHYHVISATSSTYTELLKAAPWINGGKYYGSKGTVN